MSHVHLSFIVATHNDAADIHARIGEAQRQLAGVTDQYEIVIVDDGSNDGTSHVVDQLEQGDSRRLRVVHLSRRVGQKAALEAGIAAAHGTFIAHARPLLNTHS